MKYSFKKTISMVLKILCAIAIIATAGSGEASAAKKTTNRKAKTVNVKKARKGRHSKKTQKVTELIIVDDERQIGSVDEDWGTDYKIAEEKEELKKEEPKSDKEEVFSSAYKMPTFPGGDGALMNYIANQIKYPKVAQENGVQGKVVVQFVVTKTGKIGDVKVMRGVDKALDREAVRVCKSLPAFSPGRNAEGDPVNVWYTIPIAFKLKGAK